MTSPARKVAFKLLTRIESGKAFSDDVLNSRIMETLDVRDRHLTTEIVYGTLRLRALLDYVLKDLSAKPWDEVETGVKVLLRMSLYQMWHMDRIPDHALVNDAVDLAKQELGKGIDRFVNAILRRLTRNRPWNNPGFTGKAPPWVRVSLPKWLWDRWQSRFGESLALDYASSLNRPPQLCVRLTEESVSGVQSDLVPGAAILTEEGPDPQGHHQYRYQDEASQLIPHLIGAGPGWRVWDSCAAPGGKSAILHRICGNRGLVISSDLRKERASKMRELLRASGINDPDVLVLDASARLPFRCRFDAVLADVPCSGLGTLRRNPEKKWRFSPEEFAALQQVQLSILENVSQCVRAGGRLLYSTCSTEPEENEHVVLSFLERHPEFRCEAPEDPPGIGLWTGQDGMVRTFPGARPWDGFFAALMIRG